MSKTLYVRIPGTNVDENIEYLQYNGYGIVAHLRETDLYTCSMNADLVPIPLADAEVVDEKTMLQMADRADIVSDMVEVLQTLAQLYQSVYQTRSFEKDSVAAFYTYLCREMRITSQLKLLGVFNADDLLKSMRLAFAQVPVHSIGS